MALSGPSVAAAEEAARPFIEATREPSPGLPSSLADLAESIGRSVVILSAADRRDERELIYGTGFVLSPDGYVATADDLIALGKNVRARLPDGRSLPLELVNRDPNTNLALLEVAEGVEAPPLVPLRLGDSDRIRVGEWVLTIGQSDAESPSLAKGVVAGKERVDGGIGVSARLLQLDMVLLPSFTGAPVVDMAGRVIGVVTGQGMRRDSDVLPLSFALPINEAKRALVELLDRRPRPKVWLGVRVESASLAETEANGARVTGVLPDSPAAGAKLQVGDLIIQLGDEAISSAEDLVARVSRSAPGDELVVRVVRAGRLASLRARVDRLPSEIPAADAEPETPEAPLELGEDPWGFRYAELDDDLRWRFDLPSSTEGFVVSEVVRRGPGWRADLQLGDLLVEINTRPVRTSFDLARGLREPLPILRIVRGDTSKYLALER